MSLIYWYLNICALQNPEKKNLICTWKLSFNEGNYAIKLDGGRQTDRKTDRQKDRQTDRQSLL